MLALAELFVRMGAQGLHFFYEAAGRRRPWAQRKGPQEGPSGSKHGMPMGKLANGSKPNCGDEVDPMVKFVQGPANSWAT